MATSQEKEHLEASRDEPDSRTKQDPKDDPPPRYSSIENAENALIDSEFSENGIGDYDGIGCCHPASRVHRYFVLFFMCFLAFGSYYCYDNPTSLEKKIEGDMNVTTTEYSFLYAAYSYPNVIICFFGGFLIDTFFGIRLGAIIFAGLICLGQVIFAGGAYINNFYVMVFGRLVFGLGGESLAVAQNTYAVLWFKGKELNTVFGVQLSIARLGSVANMFTILSVYNFVQDTHQGHTGLGITLMLAGLLCVFSLLCALIMGYFDKRAERILNRRGVGVGETVKLSDVSGFPFQFWMLCLFCVFYYVAIFPFIGLAGTYMQHQYNMTEVESSRITGIPYIVSAIVSPLCGMLCDFTGLNLIWSIVAAIISAGCHLTFSYAPIDLIPPEVTMGVLGLGFSLLACAFWPMVAMLIPEHQLGTAYGVMQAVQNLGMAIVITTAAMIRDHYGFQNAELYFLMWMTLSIVTGVVLLMHNIATKGELNPPLYKRNLCGRRDADTDEEVLVHQD